MREAPDSSIMSPGRYFQAFIVRVVVIVIKVMEAGHVETMLDGEGEVNELILVETS